MRSLVIGRAHFLFGDYIRKSTRVRTETIADAFP